MKENKDTACEPCEQNFERNINRLVKEGKAPTPKACQQKEHEVKSAFGETGRGAKKPLFPPRKGGGRARPALPLVVYSALPAGRLFLPGIPRRSSPRSSRAASAIRISSSTTSGCWL